MNGTWRVNCFAHIVMKTHFTTLQRTPISTEVTVKMSSMKAEGNSYCVNIDRYCFPPKNVGIFLYILKLALALWPHIWAVNIKLGLTVICLFLDHHLCTNSRFCQVPEPLLLQVYLLKIIISQGFYFHAACPLHVLSVVALKLRHKTITFSGVSSLNWSCSSEITGSNSNCLLFLLAEPECVVDDLS